MVTLEQLDRILAVASTDEQIDYFFDNLTSPEWIPLLQTKGMFEQVPEPISDDRGVRFPGWSRSRYLERVAAADPDAVVELLFDIKQTTNPRIWRDILAALAAMPAVYSIPFIPVLRSWIHSPIQLGAENEALKIGSNLAAAGMADQALKVLESLAALTPPTDHLESELWRPLDDYDYGRFVPELAKTLARDSLDALWTLSGQLEAGIAANVKDAGYTAIWRPAIENHAQNWRHHERLETLVETVRDLAIERTTDHRDELRPIVERLLDRPTAILKRIAINLLVERGELDPQLVGSVLGTKELFANTEFHHEFYRLAHVWFGRITPEAQRRYLDLVDEVGHEKGKAGEAEHAADRADWWAWNRLGAVRDAFDAETKVRYDGLVAKFGVQDHPDFLSWHESWAGSTSPLSLAELTAMDFDQLAAFLATWEGPERFGRAPTREGLARELQNATKTDPARYVAFADRLPGVPPIYAGSFLWGLTDAVKEGREFDIRPAIQLARTAIERAGAIEAEHDSDNTWRSTEMNAAWLLEEILIRDVLPDDNDGSVWASIAQLLIDPEPRSESEGTYGDPLTHSLNVPRGVAINAAVGYAWWSKKHTPNREAWNLDKDLPAVGRALADHIDPDGDPSLAIGAAFGWWLQSLIAIDSSWVEDHAGILLGDLTQPREMAAWSAFLMRATPGVANYKALRGFFDRFAQNLVASEDTADKERGLGDPVVRFIAHLTLLEIHGELPADSGPLVSILASHRPWLLRQLAEEAGRLIHGDKEIEPALADAFQRLWTWIRAAAEASDPPAKEALAAFSWWLASPLSPEWTLSELASLLDAGVQVEPEFLVLPRLAELATEDEERVLYVLERMTPQSDDEWAFRSHEDDLRKILEVELKSADAGRRERAVILIDRYGQLGMVKLGALLE